ncbi:putative vacuolar protein sorting-associated protein [Tanacetum coccineum]
MKKKDEPTISSPKPVNCATYRDNFDKDDLFKFQELLLDADKPLYEGCPDFTKLSAIVKLLNLKSKDNNRGSRAAALFDNLKEGGSRDIIDDDCDGIIEASLVTYSGSSDVFSYPKDESVTDPFLADTPMQFLVVEFSSYTRRKFHRAIAELTFEGIFVECMIWDESSVVTASVYAVESEEHFHEVRKPSLNIHTYIPKANSEGEFQVKVLKSLNGITDVKSRIISKAEYILSSRARTMWDISLINVKITIPWENRMSKMYRLVLGLTAVTFTSKRDIGCFALDINVPSQFVRNLIDIDSSSELLKGLQVQDLHDHFEIKIIDFEESRQDIPTDGPTIEEMVNATKDNFDEDDLVKFQELLLDAEKPLYEGCPDFTKLSAIIQSISEDLRWHATRRITDGVLRHPADSQAWRTIDEKFPKIAEDPRNLRLGISADGVDVNTGNRHHSVWPVLTVIYNLPPWLCMKRKFIMLSVLISGYPGNDIDVF